MLARAYWEKSNLVIVVNGHNEATVESFISHEWLSNTAPAL